MENDKWIEWVIGLYQYKYNPYVFSNHMDGSDPYVKCLVVTNDGKYVDSVYKVNKRYDFCPKNLNFTPLIILEKGDNLPANVSDNYAICITILDRDRDIYFENEVMEEN